MKPFAFSPHSTIASNVAAASVEVALNSSVEQVWIDNRGSTDLLVEFFDAPLDANSYRIQADTAQPLSTPAMGGSWDGNIRLKRPAGSASETVFVTPGAGF